MLLKRPALIHILNIRNDFEFIAAMHFKQNICLANIAYLNNDKKVASGLALHHNFLASFKRNRLKGIGNG